MGVTPTQQATVRQSFVEKGGLARLFEDPRGQLDQQLLFVFLIVNGLVLFNSIFHDPTVQYDWAEHLAYVATLAQLHLPTAHESGEFFSPPLPYLLPALANGAGLGLWWTSKLGQMINVALSLGMTGGLIVLCRWARPSDREAPLIAWMCLGALPVYFKTMAFGVRGEPYVAFLTLAGIAVTARAVTSSSRSLAAAVAAGLCWGLLVLARQWGALAVAGLLMAVWLAALRDRGRQKIVVGLAGPLVTLAVGGWFYGWLWLSQGSPIAWYKAPEGQWALANEPTDFYIGTGNGRLFTDPVRPSFPNQLIPIFYAETWGDYWCYFSIFGRDPKSGAYIGGEKLQAAVAKAPLTIETNRFTLNHYLGRVNLLGLLPSALALVAFGVAAVRLPAFLTARPLTLAEIIPVMAVLVVGVSAIGYLWFLIRFPTLGNGNTIKATYMLHIFAPLALLTADFVRRIRVPLLALIIAWGLLMMHNIPALITHFIEYPSIASAHLG
jgi:hypothetical protein